LRDAGCGTGRYAGELARRGYDIDGVDQSPELIETAASPSTVTATDNFAVTIMDMFEQ